VCLKVPSGQIGSAWERYHWIDLEKEIIPYRFFILYFWSWIFDKSSKFWATSCKNESNLLLVGLHVLNRDLFRQTMLQKCGIDINCSLDYGPWVKILTSRNPNQKRAEFWQIFSSNKNAPINRYSGFYANRDPNKQEVGLIFAWSSSELWSLFKYPRVKFKYKNL
jgi:hypothetical protein